MEKNKVKLLLVEDDINLSQVVQDYLQILQYDVVISPDGESGLNEFRKGSFDLVILDVMLPKKDGLSIAKEIRNTDQDTPIIFLTAKSLQEDRIKGFRAGCDDYLTKPFSTEELSLRIKTILKRCQIDFDHKEQRVYQLGDFIFDAENLSLTIGQDEMSLTKKEASLLKLLCQYKNKLLPREKALIDIWGANDYFFGRSMDVFITRLRKYLKQDPRISITNVHGSGFKLEVK